MKYIALLAIFFTFSGHAENVTLQDASDYLRDKEFSKAAGVYEKLGESGNDYAKHMVASFHYYGFHYEKDIHKAKEIFAELCKDYVESCTRLAIIYNELEMYDEAEIAYLKAAKGKDLEAYGDLFYLYSNKKWEKHSESKAIEWQQALEKADWPQKDCHKSGSLTKHSQMQPNQPLNANGQPQAAAH